MANIPVDLTTVTRVRIGNQWTDIEPGTFRVGYPVFTMASDEMEGADSYEVYGQGWHPLSYFFSTSAEHAPSRQRTGPYGAVQELDYLTQEN